MERSGSRPRRPPPPNVGAQRFLDIHEQAFTQIHQALSFDEGNAAEMALACYQRGIQLLEEALAMPVQLPSDLTSKRDKMKVALNDARCRVRELGPAPRPTAAPLVLSRQAGLPSYEEAVSPQTESPSTSSPHNADVMLELANAQVFFITAQGYVSSPSYPSLLRICKFSMSTVPGAPECFLQVGSFTLPLLEDLTPSLQTSPGTYVFPDITSTQEGAAVGILLDDKTPAADVEAFESLITSLTALRPSAETATAPAAYTVDLDAAESEEETALQPVQPSQDTQVAVPSAPDPESARLSTKIGHGLTVAADWMTWGLGKGAEKVGGLMAAGGQKLRANMQASVTDRHIDEKYEKSLVTARDVSHKVVVVSSFVVKALGDATLKLGKKVAPYIKSQATQMLPAKVTKPMTSKDDSGRSKMDDVMEVASAGVRGAGVVYVGLEEAAKALGRALATQTSATMCHKYGTQYGRATEHAMYTVGNTLLSAHNIVELGPKAIAKRAAKNTAKGVVVNGQAPRLPGSDGMSLRVLEERHTLEITELPSEHDIPEPHSKT